MRLKFLSKTVPKFKMNNARVKVNNQLNPKTSNKIMNNMRPK